MKAIFLGRNGKVELKSSSIDDFLRRMNLSAEASGTPYGLAQAYSASVWSFNCINLRAQTIAGVPVEIVGIDGEPLTDHPLVETFSDYASDTLWRIEASLLIWGEAYLEIVRNGFDQPVGLRWLNPQITEPGITANGIEGFTHSPSQGGRMQTFTPDEIVYIHTFDPNDDLRGLGALSVALASVGADRDTVRYTQAFFSNGARLDGILVIPDADDTQVDATEAKWKATFRGARNAFRTLIMGSRDVTYTPVSASPEDLALAAVKAETRRDVCAAFRVPPALAGAWEAANYAASREQRQSFYIETILPEIDFIEDELNRQLNPVWPEVRIAFDISSLRAVIDDEAARNQAVTVAVQGGWMTINEARARVNLPPLSDGDVLMPMPGAFPMLSSAAPEEGAAGKFFRTLPYP